MPINMNMDKILWTQKMMMYKHLHFNATLEEDIWENAIQSTHFFKEIKEVYNMVWKLNKFCITVSMLQILAHYLHKMSTC